MFGGLIKFSTYATQVGQLRTMGRSAFGDVSETSITTVNLLVYFEEDEQRQTSPNVTPLTRHFAILPTSATVNTGDHLKDVVDKNGNAVLSDARILLVDDYNSHRYGSRFKRVQLDLGLSD